MNSVTLTNYNTEFIIDEKDASSIKITKATTINKDDFTTNSDFVLIINDENGATIINKHLNSYPLDPNTGDLMISEEMGIFKFITISIHKLEMNQPFDITLYYELKT